MTTQTADGQHLIQRMKKDKVGWSKPVGGNKTSLRDMVMHPDGYPIVVGLTGELRRLAHGHFRRKRPAPVKGKK